MDFKRTGHRNMSLFFVGKLISVLGSSLYTFVAGLTVLKLTGSGSNFAVTLICGFLPRILLAPFAGVIADRVNRRALLIASDLAGVLVMLLTSAVLSLNTGSLLPIYLSLALLSACSTFYSVTVSSSLLMLVEHEQIQRAGSLNQIAASTSNILAPIAGGILYAFLPLPLFTLLNAAAFAVSTGMSASLRFKPRTVSAAAAAVGSSDGNDGSDAEVKVEAGAAITETGTAITEASAAITDAGSGTLMSDDTAAKSGSLTRALTAIKSDLWGGISYVRSRQALSTVLKLVFWINFFVASLSVMLPYILVQELEMSSEQFGTVESMMAAGMLLMSLILTVRKQSTDHVRPLTIGLYALGVLLTAIALPLLVNFGSAVVFVYYMALMLVIGITVISINIPLSVFMQTSTEEEYRGRVFGLVDTLSGAIAPLGMLIVGYLLDLVPAGILPVVSGICVMIITSLGSRKLRNASPAAEAGVKKASAA